MIQQRTCKQCNKIFMGGPRAYYCPACRVERTRETNQRHRMRKKQGVIRKLGSIDKCERCGNEYIVYASLQRFCPACQRLHSLEYDRVTSIKYYHINKDSINPVRNERRRIGLVVCKWCGKEFDAEHTGRKYCSTECKRKAINKMWMKKSYPKRLKKYVEIKKQPV